MALTEDQQRDTARNITRDHYGAGNTANLTAADWEAAVLDEMKLLFVRTAMARVGLG
jgi:hypothetical protein